MNLLVVDGGCWDSGERIAGGTIASDGEMAAYDGSNWSDVIHTPWAICRLTSTTGEIAFFARAGYADFEGDAPEFVAAFLTEAQARRALQARGYLDEEDARARYRRDQTGKMHFGSPNEGATILGLNNTKLPAPV